MYHFLENNNLLKGSILHFQNIMYSHSFWENNEHIAIDFINKSFLIFKEFLVKVKEDLYKCIEILKE